MENRKCVICGKSFFTNRWNRKSCSPECAKAHARNQRLMPIIERECPQCHKKFAPERGRAAQIYCSLECSRKHYNEQRRKEAAEAKEFLLQAQIMAENKPAKTLAEWAKEARDCNLDYGTYRALIQSGKTYEDLMSLADSRSSKTHAHAGKSAKNACDSGYGKKVG